jgi:hypothetical protein
MAGSGFKVDALNIYFGLRLSPALPASHPVRVSWLSQAGCGAT